MESYTKSGQIVDLIQKRVFPGTITIEGGKIKSIVPEPDKTYNQFILPGFIDAHVHIESSMLIPSEFARLASVHGTIGTVSDPHEIGNVLGIEGVKYMIDNGNKVPFHFNFGAPSCVPATAFETSGAAITAEEIDQLFTEEKLLYLSEMMNYPGVLSRQPLVMEKIKVAQDHGLPIDGHAPGLKGQDADRYIRAGISTDHECFTLDEALDKLNYGMKIIIREGSAAKNYEALHPLLKTHPQHVMFCSDDKHPHELVAGHINQLVQRSIAKGYNLMDVLRCASYNPVIHYNLDIGLLQKGDWADFIIVDNLKDFHVLETYVRGGCIAKDGKSLIASIPEKAINHFNTSLKKVYDFNIIPTGARIKVIQAIDNELITKHFSAEAKIVENNIISDLSRDILKLAVVSRYTDDPPAIGFIQNFGLKKGAIASSIAHDSHNIIAVGVSDEEICKAVNMLIGEKGGIAIVHKDEVEILPLPVAGLMSTEDGYLVAKHYIRLDKLAKELGSTLQAPFMTLSFMALLVIPSLKLSDKGLFDGDKFEFSEVSF